MHINENIFAEVVELLITKIPINYYYHNVNHSLLVMQQAEEIGVAENCNPDEIVLLKTAALWHDTGFINTYKEHEEAGVKLVEEHLPKFGFSPDEITIISGMIMATKIPQAPKNKLEKIIADADLSYLGMELAGELAYDLYRELHSLNPELSKKDWNKIEIEFIRTHYYHTDYCKINREPKKLLYLQSLY